MNARNFSVLFILALLTFTALSLVLRGDKGRQQAFDFVETPQTIASDGNTPTRQNQTPSSDFEFAEPDKYIPHGSSSSIPEKQQGSCDQSCQNIVLEQLSLSGTLSADHAAIIFQNPDEFAQLLKDQPVELASLLASLQKDEDQDNGTQSAAYAVLEALPLTDKAEVGGELAVSKAAQERLIGLKLIAPTLDNNSKTIDAFNRLLTKEEDPRVLSVAINIASTLPRENDVEETLDALTSIILFNDNDHFSGSALMAKTKIAPSASLVREDVLDAVYSHSTDKQSFGLRAFETAMQRFDDELESNGNWYTDEKMRAAITSLANDNSTSSRVRTEAHRLRERYFPSVK